jgi:3-oxoacyl-[acyl-carrier protein] reductase
MGLGLQEEKAIVTGGSRGIGGTICELLAEESCDLAPCTRGKVDVDEAVTGACRQGVRAHGGMVGVADTNALCAWIANAVKQLGGRDVGTTGALTTASRVDGSSDVPRVFEAGCSSAGTCVDRGR